MENLYPLFERNRILKKEMLWSLRDYSFTHMQLEYKEYTDGMIKGCELKVKDGELAVGSGIVKHKGFIYLLTEEMRIPYEHNERLEVLKMKMKVDSRSEDAVRYQLHLFLDEETEKKEDEIEVCRFHLRKGAELRDSYEDFSDMMTAYDTLNVVDADWGGLEAKTLSPRVTGYFAEQILTESGSRPEDINFAYLCLSQSGTVSRKILEHYISQRLGRVSSRDCGKEGQQELYQGLLEILEKIHNGGQTDAGEREEKRRRILVY